jgi:ubiquinone/menaquinone biosynthesis C-methylase UbiE
MNETIRRRKERSIWSKQAAGYDRRTMRIYEQAYDLSIRKACSVISFDQRVLEIGCGTGVISLGVAPHAAEIVGIDISPEMVEIAERKAERQGISNVDFRVGDGYALPFEDGSFDAVLLFNTLHVVREPAALLREAHRLLKPSGHLVTATDCYAEPVPLTTRLKLGVQRLLHVVGVIPFISYFTREDLLQLFEQSAFEVAETDVLHVAPVNTYVLASKAKV